MMMSFLLSLFLITCLRKFSALAVSYISISYMLLLEVRITIDPASSDEIIKCETAGGCMFAASRSANKP